MVLIKTQKHAMKHKEWHDSVNDILENIEKVGYMNITGGELYNCRHIGNY